MKTKMLILPLLFKTKDLLSTLILIYFIILKEREIFERGKMKEIIGVIISRKRGIHEIDVGNCMLNLQI